MMTMTISLVMASSLLGTGHCGHDKVAERMLGLLRRESGRPWAGHEVARRPLTGWPAARRRRALGKYDWKCHPEAADALADALLHDDKALVRQEAAEALAKMKPCLPAAHEAVAKAARCDDCFLTRLWARKAPEGDRQVVRGRLFGLRARRRMTRSNRVCRSLPVRRPRRWIPRSSRSLADDPIEPARPSDAVSLPAGDRSARAVDRSPPGSPPRPGRRVTGRRSRCPRSRQQTPPPPTAEGRAAPRPPSQSARVPRGPRPASQPGRQPARRRAVRSAPRARSASGGNMNLPRCASGS